MFSIAVFLDAAKARAGIESDYRLAKTIEITHAAISEWRNGKSLPNESTIVKLCALSGDDPDLVAAQIQAKRSKDAAARALWSRVALRLQGAASAAILSVVAGVLILGFSPFDSTAYAAPASTISQFTVYTSYLVALLSWLAFHTQFGRFFTRYSAPRVR